MKSKQYLHYLISNILYRKSILVFCFTWIFLLFTIPVSAIYSEKYDEEISHLVVTDPKRAVQISQKKLQQAQLSQNIKEQLISLYYKASALDVLSEQVLLDETIDKGLKLATKHQNQRFKSEFLGLAAIRLELKGHYLEAINKSNQALQYARETDDERLIAEQTAVRGQVQLAIENYEFALKDVEAAIKVFKQNNDNENLSLNYNLLAIIYSSILDYDNAIKYYKESDLYDLVKSSYNQAILNYNLGTVYLYKDDYDQATIYYKKSSELSQKTNDAYSLAFSKYGLSEIYLLQDKIKEAETELTPLFEIFKKNNDILMLFNINLLMADIKTSNKLYEEAYAFITQAEQQSKIIDTPIVNLNLITQKTIYHVAREEWKKAYELNKQYNKLNDEVIKISKEHLISDLRIRYNAQFDQEKMELLQSQNKLQQTAIIQEKTTKKYLWGLIGLGLIVLLITYLGYRNQRKMKRRLFQVSITDYLTRVANRRHIIERFKELHLLSLNENQSFTLVMVDLDFFKSINDNYGHDTGNEVLIYFAKTAKTVMSNIGEVGRIGGEEWIILIKSIDLELIVNKLNELRLIYKEALSIKIPEGCNLSFSSGVLTCTGQYQSYEKMLSNVDSALYEAKQKGREQDVFV